MSISSSEIRKRLRGIWPGLKHIWLTDSKYLAMPKDLAHAVLASWKQEINKFSFSKTGTHIFECEEFALFCQAFVRKYQINNRNDTLNWSFGECIAKKIRGSKYIHSCNLYLTENNIYLVEPQTGVNWEAEPDLDTIFFVKM